MALYTVKVKLMSLLGDESFDFFFVELLLNVVSLAVHVGAPLAGGYSVFLFEFFLSFESFDRLKFFPVFLLFTLYHYCNSVCIVLI